MTKTLKFRAELTPLIINGSKYATWRLDDDKDISVGDVVELLEFGTLNNIATVKVYEVIVKKFKDLSETDKLGHEAYDSNDAMYESFSNDYKKPVGPETEVKVIRFNVLKLH